MPTPSTDNRGLWEVLLGDGRFLLSLTGMALLASGAFAVAQSISGQLLPQDVQALGMDAATLMQRASHNVLRFMFHDRVAFGGTLLAIGLAYWWLVEFPLRAGVAWAWWTLALSGGTGFLSFLTYLGYGYLDTWHGVATLLLLFVYLMGMWRARRLLTEPLRPAYLWKTERKREIATVSVGRTVLSLCGAGLVLAGATILVVGMTFVFVPQDIVFMGIAPEKLRAVSPMLIPVIAHDRAGFGGGLLTTGLILILIMRHSTLTRNVVELMALMGLCGFGAALGVHFAVGYTDFMHLLPAYAGFLMFAVGTGLMCVGLFSKKQNTFAAAANS